MDTTDTSGGSVVVAATSGGSTAVSQGNKESSLLAPSPCVARGRGNANAAVGERVRRRAVIRTSSE